jgi:GTP-binding protein
MRLIADAGIIGYPNVGKSSLLAKASAAKPQVAGYPFTTKEPMLGLVAVGIQYFIMAEIPGLIEDAHLGKGLGHDFLRHIRRTKVLIHLIDGSGESPVGNMDQINEELRLFDSALAQKPQIAAVNKIDMHVVRTRMDDMRKAFKRVGVRVHFISAATGEGVPELMSEVVKMVKKTANPERRDEKVAVKVFQPQPVDSDIQIQKEGDCFVLMASELERLVAGTDLSIPGVEHEIERQFIQMGADKALKKAGVKPGDKVRCGGLKWEW